MSYSLVNQLPILPPTVYSPSSTAFIVPRVLELTYTAWDLAPFAADLWADADDDLRARLQAQHDANRAATGGHPWAPPAWANLPETPPASCPLSPFKWDDDRRALLRAELDAYYARLYGLTRDELRYILDPKAVYGPDFPGETFRVLKEKEERQFGEYRTQRLVLAAWDQLEAELGPVVVRNYREELAAPHRAWRRPASPTPRMRRCARSLASRCRPKQAAAVHRPRSISRTCLAMHPRRVHHPRHCPRNPRPHPLAARPSSSRRRRRGRACSASAGCWR